MSASETIYLIDGSSFIYRAFHAMEGLRSSSGTPTGAVYGFAQMMKKILSKIESEMIVIALDVSGPTVREKIYSEYKKNRPEMPLDLQEQWPIVEKYISAMGIPMVKCEGYEADDVIGTLAKQAEEKDMEVVIYTGDKDMLQLINQKVKVCRTHQHGEKLYDESLFRERYGTTPDKLPDILGLMGDSSDNIPGIPGIGEKTAIKLISEYGSLESLFEKKDEISKPKLKEKLYEHEESAIFSRELATIIKDVPLSIKWEDLFKQEPDVDSLKKLYTELNMTSLLAELPQEESDKVELDYKLISNEKELSELISQIKNKGSFAIDTETTGLDPMKNRIVGFSVATDAGKAAYIPLGHREMGNININTVKEYFEPVFKDKSIKKYGHHLKFDRLVLLMAGMELEGVAGDSLISASLLEPSDSSKILDNLAMVHFNVRMTPITDLIGKGRSAVTMADIDISTVCKYACADADMTWRLCDRYSEILKNDLDTQKIIAEIEIPLSEILIKMERDGILVDPEVLNRQSLSVESKMNDVADRIYDMVGQKFNLNSPKQLGEILFDVLKLPAGRKRSTRADILEKLAAQGHEVPEYIIEYRHLQKLKSTYLDALVEKINPDTGRIHTSYHQTITTTGRISSSDPNLQNIPIRTELGRLIREAFIASPGHKLLSADYSQIELRMVAHLSGDSGMKKAFSNNEDIHSRTAAEIFGVEINDVDKSMRRKAKEINFGLIYGMGPYGLSERLGIPVGEATSYIDKYFSRFPEVKLYMSKILDDARKDGYVKTIGGRKINVPGINSEDRNVRENSERAAINAPVQGSAAEMLKMAMIRMDRELKENNLISKMILTIHDELILEVPEDELEGVEALTKKVMSEVIELDVPVVVDSSIGFTWAELK